MPWADVLLIFAVIGVGALLFLLAYVVSRPRRRTPLKPRHPGPPPREDESEGDDGGGGVATIEAPTIEAPPAEAPPVEAPPVEVPLRERFRERLSRTRNVLGVAVVELFGGGLSDEAWERLEETLIAADVGVETSLALVERVRQRAREEGVTDAEGVRNLLREELSAVLGVGDRSLHRRAGGQPTVWLVTGVNGTGKTTSIGKIAAQERRDRKSVV